MNTVMYMNTWRQDQIHKFTCMQWHNSFEQENQWCNANQNREYNATADPNKCQSQLVQQQTTRLKYAQVQMHQVEIFQSQVQSITRVVHHERPPSTTMRKWPTTNISKYNVIKQMSMPRNNVTKMARWSRSQLSNSQWSRRWQKIKSAETTKSNNQVCAIFEQVKAN